ncbi:MAG TPA: (4Fe-4S)-binding protein [Bacteroidales bacterium]|nr:(4Fe-4S)-binding protein [Bacteroidales bacterium]
MEKNMSLSDDREYTNGEITVYWKPGACVHASYCYRELIEVFDPSRRPWVDMKGASTMKIIETVNMCPTEALTWKWNDEGKNEDVGSDQYNHVKFRRPELMEKPSSASAGTPVSVKVMNDGPIIIKGNFNLKYGDIEKEIKDSLISICRCGRSEHQPFCDGTHRKKGFIG